MSSASAERSEAEGGRRRMNQIAATRPMATSNIPGIIMGAANIVLEPSKHDQFIRTSRGRDSGRACARDAGPPLTWRKPPVSFRQSEARSPACILDMRVQGQRDAQDALVFRVRGDDEAELPGHRE